MWGRPTRCTLFLINLFHLTLILLTWRIWWAPNNASKWQMGFNSVFKGLNYPLHFLINNCSFFIVVPWILITLKFLSPTNAPLYYIYKMLKYTARSSPDCSYIFRSTLTIIRESMPNLVKVTIYVFLLITPTKL